MKSWVVLCVIFFSVCSATWNKIERAEQHQELSIRFALKQQNVDILEVKKLILFNFILLLHLINL